MNLREKSFKALFWSGADILGRHGVQFGISVLLARLLEPSEFGLLGMLSLFTGLAGAFIDSGFSSALVQRQDVSQTDLSSVFYFNLLLGLLMALAMTLAGPWIADFYDIPVLAPLANLSALSLLIGALGSVQLALRNRDLDFKTQTMISLVAVILSGGVGVILAWQGYGVWSLAWQGVVFNFISTLLIWVLRPWRPSLTFSLASLRSLWTFGSSLLFSGLLNALFSKLHLLLIGKLYSPADLGFYTRAYSTQQLPAGLLSAVVGRVAFPLFATVQHDHEVLRKGLRRAVSLLMMINLPIMLGIAVTARPLVFVVFGEKWAPCIPYLQVLCIAGIFWPLHIINLNALKALGRSDLFFRLEVIKRVLQLIVLLATARIGVFAIALGEIFLSAVSFYLNTFYLGKLITYRFSTQITDFMPYFICSLIMTCACYALTLLPFHSHFLLLTIQIFGGCIVYLGLCHVLKLTTFKETSHIIYRYFSAGHK